MQSLYLSMAPELARIECEQRMRDAATQRRAAEARAIMRATASAPRARRVSFIRALLNRPSEA